MSHLLTQRPAPSVATAKPAAPDYAQERIDQSRSATLVKALLREEATPALAAPSAPRLRSFRPIVGECRTCSTCQHSKDLSEFAVKRGTQRATKCRACQKVLSDAHYQKNKERLLVEAAARNSAMRASLTRARNAVAQADCVCENCSSTVELRWTNKDDYTGPTVHEVIGGSLGHARLAAALEGSRVFCAPCMFDRYRKKAGESRA